MFQPKGPSVLWHQKASLREATWLYVPGNQHFTFLLDCGFPYCPVLSRQTLIQLNVLLPFATGYVYYLYHFYWLQTAGFQITQRTERVGLQQDQGMFHLKLEVENTNSFGTGPFLKSVITIFTHCYATRRTRRVWSLSVNGQRLVDVWVKYQHIQLTLMLKMLYPDMEKSLRNFFFFSVF